VDPCVGPSCPKQDDYGYKYRETGAMPTVSLYEINLHKEVATGNKAY